MSGFTRAREYQNIAAHAPLTNGDRAMVTYQEKDELRQG